MVDTGSWSKFPPLMPPSPAEVQPEPIPYHFLPGADGGIASPTIDASVDALFPFADGIVEKLKDWDPVTHAFVDREFPKVGGASGLGIDPAALPPDEFLDWHSSYQVLYVETHGKGTPKAIILTDNTVSPAQSINVINNTAKDRIIILEHLAKESIARLPMVDQQLIAAMPIFTQASGIAARLGLIPAAGATVSVRQSNGTFNSVSATDSASAKAALKLYIDQEIALVTVNGTGKMTNANAQVFRDQLLNVKKRIENSAIFSIKEISDQVQLITTRYERAKLFGQVKTPYQLTETKDNVTVSLSQYKDVVSTDGNQMILTGFENFMKQERQLLALDNLRLEIASSGLLKNKKLDVPNLVFQFQLAYNLTAEAKVAADTEEINQQNALLQTYGKMQQLVNGASKSFGTDQEENRTIRGTNSGEELGSTLTYEQQLICSMFEDIVNGQKHPIEELRGITRPLQEIYAQKSDKKDDYLAEQRKTQWDSFNTQLSDTVTLINQENQIKMNDINSMNKQKDRHFDLANGALSKMFDTIQNIARATGS